MRALLTFQVTILTFLHLLTFMVGKRISDRYVKGFLSVSSQFHSSSSRLSPYEVVHMAEGGLDPVGRSPSPIQVFKAVTVMSRRACPRTARRPRIGLYGVLILITPCGKGHLSWLAAGLAQTVVRPDGDKPVYGLSSTGV